jgi:hypothetical protein
MSERDKNIFVITEQGGSGKSHVSTNLIDQLRVMKKPCASYLLDTRATATLNRMGQKNSFGEPEEDTTKQDPVVGVKQYDILNQNGLPKDKHKEVINEFIASLKSPVKYSAYDFPGQGVAVFENLYEKGELVDGEYQDGELGYIIKRSKKDYIIVIPVNEQKSLASIIPLLKTFTFTGDYESLNDRVKFVAIYNPNKETPGMSFEQFTQADEYQALRSLGDRFKVFQTAYIDTDVLNSLGDRPFSDYYDMEEEEPLNVPEVFASKHQEDIFGMRIRKLFTGKTGFPYIVKNAIVDWSK